MANPIRLEDAFEDCIARLANHATIDDCLALYPQYARELRPMLEAGLLIRRVRYTSAEVTEAQNRVRFRVAGAVNSAFGESRVHQRQTRSLLNIAALIVVFFAGAIAALLVFNRGTEVIPAGQITEEPLVAETLTPTHTETAIATYTPTPSLTLTLTPTHTATVTATHTPTPSLTLTRTLNPTAARPPATATIFVNPTQVPLPTSEETHEEDDSHEDDGDNSGHGGGSDDDGSDD